MTNPQTTSPPPRFVDAHGCGWRTCFPPAPQPPEDDPWCAVFPALDEDHIGEQKWRFSQILAVRGPIRPVDLPSNDDRDLLKALLAHAKTQAAGTLIFALHALHDECVRVDGHSLRLTAGRPGSWEADVLQTLSRNCVPITEVANEEHPEFGPHPGLENLPTVIYHLLHGWLFDPARQVELAETLAHLFGTVVDGRGGWDQVTTSRLRGTQQGQLAEQLLRYTSRYYSQHA